jgi:hypothetical protein
MSTRVLDPERITETIRETEDAPDTDSGDAPPIYGRCPVCGKPLFPRDRFTGQLKAPPPGAGYESRAKCSGCGTILCYMGSGRWRVLTPDDLSDDDRQADRFDQMIGGW